MTVLNRIKYVDISQTHLQYSSILEAPELPRSLDGEMLFQNDYPPERESL